MDSPPEFASVFETIGLPAPELYDRKLMLSYVRSIAFLAM
jgi:hypothetical protein